jgi:iron complex outermembrane receptor protein
VRLEALIVETNNNNNNNRGEGHHMSASKKRALLKLLTISVSPLALIAGGAARAADAAPIAQSKGPSVAIDEVVVTARKRDETLISTPVVESAVSARELNRRAINNLDGVARVVPQLIIAHAGSSVQGGIVTMRGISGPDQNPFADQAVAFNIDGEQVAKASVRRMSDFDVSQIEILKGPQALFFGKNSPAGVISIKTNDPTDSFSFGATAAYEFNAREIRTEAFVSGPLTDALDGRLAGYYSHMDGWLKDQTPRSSPYFDSSRDPVSRDFGIRGTLIWTPTPRLDAKLKLNYGETRNNGTVATLEYISCPAGHRQTGSSGQCSAGGEVVNTSNGPIIGTFPGTLNRFGNGRSYLYQKQALGSLEINYRFSPEVLLTAVTGYYYADMEQSQNFQNDYIIIIPSDVPYRDSEISQEIRLTTSFQAPINISAGAYFSDSHTQTGGLTYLFGSNFDLFGPGVGGPTTPFLINDYFLKQRGRSYSAYLQLIYKPIEVLEIDVGGRYSYEEKSLPLVSSSPTAFLGAGSILNTPVRDDSWTDFSPEATIAYRPSANLTLFASYKHGFLSGGFNSGSSDFTVNPDLSYLPQTIEGEEIGVKAALLGGALRVNAAAYTYDVHDLQVSSYVDVTSAITNAGAVNIKGAEADMAYQTPLNGLSIHGAMAYNHGRYTKFSGAPCYNGQTPAAGCTIINGNPQQDLSGTELIRAPEWNVSGGVNFERDVGSGLRLGLSADVSYSASFLTDATSDPSGREPAYTLVDSNLRLSSEAGRWEVALVGRNLTNRHYWVSSNGAPFSGSNTGTAAGTLGDRFASVSRGREIMIRASYKY